MSGLDRIYQGRDRAAIGLDHERAGDIVALAKPNAWFAYPYWLEDRAAPDYARTVDIHRKPGYDPCELFFNPKSTSTQKITYTYSGRLSFHLCEELRMIGRMFLGRYEAIKLLGEGGMGRVYLARQADLGRQVVVKVMHDHIASDPKFRERFQRETLLMARFHHPHAVTLYDASLNDPAGPCIVMEYVKGQNLEALLAKNKRLTAPRVARIVGQLCEVLQAAHDEGVIHRDLKPANLMLIDPDTPRERIKVMDFGLAKLVEDGPARKVTDTNIDFAVGTPGYIAPEQ